MNEFPTPLELNKIKVYPLAQRKSLSAIENLLVDPQKPAPPCAAEMQPQIRDCVEKIIAARKHGASVMLIYGAHLVKNGLLNVANALIQGGWITHLATNG